MGQRVISTTKQEFTSNKRLTAILFLFWSWDFALFWNNIFDPDVVVPIFSSITDIVWVTSLTANIVTLIGILCFLRTRPTKPNKPWRIVASLFMSAGFLVLLLGLPVYLDSMFLIAAGSAMTGVGTGVLFVCFGYLFGRISTEGIVTTTALGVIGGAILCLAMTQMSDYLVACLLITIPLLLGHLCETESESPVSMPGETALQMNNHRGISLYKTFIFLFITVGMTLGLIRIFAFSTLQIDMNVYLFILAVFVSGCFLLILQNLFAADDMLTPAFIAVAIIAASFVVMVFMGKNSSIALVIHTIGFSTFNAIVWVYCAAYSRHNDHELHIFLVGLLAFQSGQLLGYVIGLLTDALNAANAAVVLSIGIVWLLFVILIFVFYTALKSKLKDVRSSDDSMEASCASLGNRYGLTNREAQIMELFAKGRNRDFIAKKCFISAETVKSHIKSIYAKLGIHSRQELLDIIENEEINLNPPKRGVIF